MRGHREGQDRNRGRRLVCLSFWIASLCWPWAGRAQPRDVFIESLDVSVVNVDVYVTDRDGHPVQGLTRDDFELRVGRRKVPISNFFAVQGGLPVRDAVASPPPPSPATAEVPPAASANLPEAQRLHLVIYIDNTHLHQLTRNRSIRQLREFLRDQLAPGDRVMIVTHDQGLHVRLPFTDRREAISQTLFEIEELSASSVEYESERRDVLDLIERAESSYSVMTRVKSLADSRYNQVLFTLDALRSHVEMLAGLPGRKALLYVSDGLPMRPGEDLYHALHYRFDDTALLAESLRNDVSRHVQRLVELANTYRVTFYPLESAGLRSFSFAGAESASAAGGVRVDQVQWSNLRSTLFEMAEETGGQAIVNTNNQLELLQRVGQDLDNFYSLGFMPATQEQGISHAIEVRLVSPPRGTEIRYRRSYRERSAEQRMSDATRAALQLGFTSNPLRAELVVGKAELAERTPGADEQFQLALLVAVPIRSITLAPQDDRQQGRLRLYLGTHDPAGRLSSVHPIDVPIDIPSEHLEAALEQMYTYELSVRVRPGLQMLAVGIRDEIGGQTAFLAREIDVRPSS